MVFWSSAIDASKAHKYEAIVVEDLLPPKDETHDLVIPPLATTSMKQLPKPTANLPDDHGVATGEKTKPAFSTANPTATSTNIHDDIAGTAGTGWFSDMSKLLTSQKWVFIALGVVLLFGIAVGIFFWRRHLAKRSARYTELNNEREMSVNPSGNSAPSGGLRTTRELYDPFGHVSDDEDDEDDDNEMTALTSARGGFGFHTDSLNVEAEDPSSDAIDPESIYRDDPESDDEESQGEFQEDKEPPKVDALASAASAIVALSEHTPSHD